MFFLKVFIFMCIWIAGCAMQEYVFHIENFAYIMSYGYFVGGLGFISMKAIDNA